jgi:outer membrane lipoprotein
MYVGRRPWRKYGESKGSDTRAGNKFMKAERSRSLFVSIAMASLLLLAGCAPVISRGALKQVDQSLTFEQLLENPEAYRGKTVLLGGNIIETQNFSDRTLITVLQSPLDFRKKPAVEDKSRGRFIVYVSGFLDPAIYRNGRKITAVGSVVGEEVRPLGEIEYSYPVIEKKELYLWPTEESSLGEPSVHFGVGIGIWH